MQIVEEQLMGSSCRKRAGLFCTTCQDVSSIKAIRLIRLTLHHLLPKVTCALKGTRFQSVEAVIEKEAHRKIFSALFGIIAYSHGTIWG